MSEDDIVKSHVAPHAGSRGTREYGEIASSPLDKLLRISLQSIGLWTAYFGSVFALVVAYNKFGQELGITSHLTIFALGGIPLVVTLCTHSIPAWWNHRRKRRVEDYGKHGQITKPRYFRLSPYESEDRTDFERSDNAHADVFNWIRRNKSPVLYLSGASGTGKSSLLNAWVLPELQSCDSPFVCLKVRTFCDPIKTLEEALTQPGAVWRSRPPEAACPRALLEKACEYLRDKDLLILLDQFEEFLILHDEATRRELQQLLLSLSRDPIPGLTVLLSLRSEYLGQLDDGMLPPIEKGDTWMEIAPFDLRMAQQFLDGSGLTLDSSLRYQVLMEATNVEGTQGLIRPITLNMFGVLLNRFSCRLPKGVEPGALLLSYVRQVVNSPDIKTESSAILREMITSGGARAPKSEQALVQATGYKPDLVRGALLTLANQGIVRRIDVTNRIWEVSHDFIASLLARLLIRTGREIEPPSLLWWATSVVILWFVVWWAGSRFYVKWRHEEAIQKIGLSDVNAFLDTGSYIIVFPPDTRDAKLTAVAHALSQLKHPVSQIRLDGARLANIDPLAPLRDLKMLDVKDAEVADLSLEGLTALQSLDLSGTILTDLSLKGLTALQSLDLGGTTLTDLSLEALPALQSLDLRHTKVTDLSPLQGLPALQSLNLWSSDIIDLSPLQGLPTLRSLDLSDTAVTDLSPLQGLPALQLLRLSDTAVTDLSPLQGLPALRSFVIYGTGTTVTDLSLEGFPALQSLKLRGTILTDLSLEGLPALQSLDLSGTRVTDLSLEGLPALQSLDLRHTKVTDLSLEGLPALQSLDLGGTALTDLSLEALPALQSLDLRHTKVTDLSPLQGLPALQSLNLRRTKVTDLSLEALPALQSLDLRHTKVTDLSPLQGLPALHSLSLRRMKVTDLSPLQGLPALQSLDLSYSKVTDLSPLQGLPALQSLDLRRTKVTDLSPLQGLPALQSLNLSYSKVTDLSPLQGLPALQSLDLSYSKVTDLSPLQGLPSLQNLFVGELPPGERYALQRSMPHLRIVTHPEFGWPTR